MRQGEDVMGANDVNGRDRKERRCFVTIIRRTGLDSLHEGQYQDRYDVDHTSKEMDLGDRHQELVSRQF